MEETAVQPRSPEGRQVGAYRILKQLGAGGMGHVYLALDTRLGRHVAVKFLPPDLSSDETLLQRLEMEARAASALNHPNILTIYDICEFNRERFIVSEYIEGTTLRAVMDRGPIDLGTALDIASQVASALMAAHSAGIVHRDLKPANIMIRPDGYIKVIDFGIAKNRKPANRAHAQPASDLTMPGSVIGTVAYMSPEQMRGEEVDARTDVWSLGVILFEMLAHKRPFEGVSESGVVDAIQNNSIPPLPPMQSQAAMEAILQRALAKNPGKRYQSAGEMLADLHQLSHTSGFSSKIRPVVIARSNTRAPWIIAAVALAILAAGGALWWWPLGGKERLLGPRWFAVGAVRQLTFNGHTTMGALSPDGDYLAFVQGDPGGQQALYVKQVESSTEELKIPARKISYAGLAFSPDSKYIFETEKDETLTGRLYAVPIVGAPAAHPILEDIDGPASFSPSGHQFAFVRYEEPIAAGPTEDSIFVAAADGSQLRKLVSFRNVTLNRRVAWSPDGQRIAAFLYRSAARGPAEEILDLIDLSGHEMRKAVPGLRAIGQFGWTPDGRTLILACSKGGEAENREQLRQLDIASGRTIDLLQDLAGYRGVALARDGSEIATVKQTGQASLWISNPSDFTVGRSAPAETEDFPSLGWGDQNRVIINSRRSGFPNLWVFDPATQVQTALTNEPHVERDAAAIAGGGSVVFSSNRDGQFHLWRYDADTNRYVQLTFGSDFDTSPAVSADGRSIVYTSWTASIPHLRRISMNGGASRQIGSDEAQAPQISPDGKWIACQFEDPVSSKWAVGILPSDGSASPRVVPGAELPIRWAPTGHELTAVRTDSSGVSNVWAIPLNGSPARQLTHFEADSIAAFAWSRSGQRLACLRTSAGGDVVLFKREKNR